MSGTGLTPPTPITNRTDHAEVTGRAEVYGPKVAGDLFRPWSLLPLSTRLKLAEILCVDGEPIALFDSEVTGLPLPDSPHARHRLEELLCASIPVDLGSGFPDSRVADLVPAAAGLRGQMVCPTHVARVFRRRGPLEWSTFGRLTFRELEKGLSVGSRFGFVLVRMAISDVLGNGTLPYSVETPGRPPGRASEVPASVRTLLDYERTMGRQRLQVALNEFVTHEAPPDVVAAARALGAVDDLLMQTDRPSDGEPTDQTRSTLRTTKSATSERVVGEATKILHSIGSLRDRAVFEHLHLELGERVNGTELAKTLGLGRESVSRIRTATAERVHNGVEALPAQTAEALAELLTELRGRLGCAVQTATVNETLRTLGLPTRFDTRSALLLWLAGPYTHVPGSNDWLVSDSDTLEVATATTAVLAEDGGVRTIDSVLADLTTLGIIEGEAAPWLARQPVRCSDGLVVSLVGSCASVVERILFATGSPMTVAAIEAWFADVTQDTRPSTAALVRALTLDARFATAGTSSFGLAEWIPERSGRTVSPTTATSSETRRTQHHYSPEDLVVRVPVTAVTLAGTPGAVEASLVDALAIDRGGARTFTTRFGPIVLAFPIDGPRHGSLRPVALAAGAKVGDFLVLDFSPPDTSPRSGRATATVHVESSG